MGALSAIDIALWDIMGKYFDTPVHQLLGGKVRDKARVYYHVFGDTTQVLTEGIVNAKEQGFTANHAISFLQRATEQSLPESIHKALQNWANEGVSAQLTKMTVVTFNSESILQMLLSDPQTKQYLAEQIGPLTVQVRYGNRKKLRDHMIKLGLILEIND